MWSLFSGFPVCAAEIDMDGQDASPWNVVKMVPVVESDLSCRLLGGWCFLQYIYPLPWFSRCTLWFSMLVLSQWIKTWAKWKRLLLSLKSRTNDWVAYLTHQSRPDCQDLPASHNPCVLQGPPGLRILPPTLNSPGQGAGLFFPIYSRHFDYPHLLYLCPPGYCTWPPSLPSPFPPNLPNGPVQSGHVHAGFFQMSLSHSTLSLLSIINSFPYHP